MHAAEVTTTSNATSDAVHRTSSVSGVSASSSSSSCCCGLILTTAAIQQ